jgi:hypothetical protein
MPRRTCASTRRSKVWACPTSGSSTTSMQQHDGGHAPDGLPRAQPGRDCRGQPVGFTRSARGSLGRGLVRY